MVPFESLCTVPIRIL